MKPRAIGVDLSEWDLRPLNWRQASELLSFAFIKISQGTNPDPLFRAQWEAAEGWILRGLYHMLEPRHEVDSSVDRTLDLYRAVLPGELPPALDLELGSVRTELPRARQWLERWEEKTGKRPIIYTSLGFLNQEQFKPENKWLSRYPLWLSAWPFDNMSDLPRRERIRQVLRGEILLPYPMPPKPWPLAPDWFQWTSRGEPEDIPGYYLGRFHKEAVDLNYYFGGEDDLFTRFGRPYKRPQNGVNMPIPYKYSITPAKSDGLRIRSDHYVKESPIPNRISSLPFGRFAFGDDKWISPPGATEEAAVELWLRVKSVDGVPIDGWAAAKHQGVVYGRIASISEGEEPGEETPSENWTSSLNVKLEAQVTAAGLDVDLNIAAPGFVSQVIKVTLPKEE